MMRGERERNVFLEESVLSDAAVPARVSSRRAFRRGGSRRGAVSVNAAHFEAVQAISDLAAGVGLPCTVRPPPTARRTQPR